MSECRRRWLSPLFAASLVASPAVAQTPPAREVVLAIENVRFDYAQVLAVHPIQQVLRTTSRERVCGPPGHTVPAAQAQPGARNCRMAPVVREYRRTIAYDVDYAYRGAKFRTRMDRDPGNRLRIRISITPAPIN